MKQWTRNIGRNVIERESSSFTTGKIANLYSNAGNQCGELQQAKTKSTK